ncbi:uncharacterized protein LOC118434561 isoform X2 [Folsomia candida]|uniref:uncharacterized protein LOC118434561 isoform X2 n=1 Tax=Folsomia candida TaxID=158441 RepID=UPI0016050827|nr:uncharacterized protein LOC118434561 isoform X2 [Folsomia candida]
MDIVDMVLGIFACYVFTILVLVIRCIIQGIFLVCYGELEEETENERKMRQYSVDVFSVFIEDNENTKEKQDQNKEVDIPINHDVSPGGGIEKENTVAIKIETVINNTNFEEKPENLPKIVENVELEKDDHQDEITVNEVTVEMDASDNDLPNDGDFKDCAESNA